MEPHVERMTHFLTELNDLVVKLVTFVENNPTFKSLPLEEQYDMRLLLQFMMMYKEILRNRIGRAAAKSNTFIPGNQDEE